MNVHGLWLTLSSMILLLTCTYLQLITEQQYVVSPRAQMVFVKVSDTCYLYHVWNLLGEKPPETPVLIFIGLFINDTNWFGKTTTKKWVAPTLSLDPGPGLLKWNSWWSTSLWCSLVFDSGCNVTCSLKLLPRWLLHNDGLYLNLWDKTNPSFFKLLCIFVFLSQEEENKKEMRTWDDCSPTSGRECWVVTFFLKT